MVNGPRIQQIKSEITECKQRGMSIVNYYGKLKQLWDELANYDQMPMCKCGKCECNLGSEFEKKQEEERVHTFLMGLDETTYGTIRSNILAQDPLPNLNKVYSILILEERARTVARGKEERGEVLVFVVRIRMNEKDKSVVCSHCRRNGHEAESCFALIRYPDWWVDRPRNDKKDGGGGRGQQPSQQQQTGVGRGRGDVKIYAAQTSPGNTATESISEGNVVGSLGLSSDQLQGLLNLLNSQKISNTEKMNGKQVSWIIDTGESNHMTGTLNLLHDLEDIVPCTVGMPWPPRRDMLFLMEGFVLIMFYMCRD